MQTGRIRKVVIAGGGTAGWIAAAALVKVLGKLIEIELVESDDIGTVGVGEATIPQIRLLNSVLGLDEDEFLAATQGTFKLGIEFRNWGGQGEQYLHTFGDVGLNLAGVPFHHYWLRAQQAGSTASLWDYSLHNTAAYKHRFGRLERVGNTSMTGLAYAFHFDAGLYARHLRRYAEGLGVTRTEGMIGSVNRDAASGDIASLTLRDGRRVAGDLFVDCTGFRALLLGETLGVGYQDWSNWLPMNRAWAVPCERADPLLPYTRATAHEAGWQWRIPLQHRTGNGHVFSEAFISEDRAQDTLASNLDGARLGDFRLLKFVTGRRNAFWDRNCIAIGLASGFMEPLESTSIHLIQSNINRLISLFPLDGIASADREEYNRQVIYEFERIRDFLIAHYKLTKRDDTPFWSYVRNMDIPESLQNRLDVFRANGRIFRDPEDLFKEASWLQVMVGQGEHARGHHPLADLISEEQLAGFLHDVKAVIGKAVDTLPPHADFIARTCSAARVSA
jgi:tryptophan 7-halogenase